MYGSGLSAAEHAAVLVAAARVRAHTRTRPAKPASHHRRKNAIVTKDDQTKPPSQLSAWHRPTHVHSAAKSHAKFIKSGEK